MKKLKLITGVLFLGLSTLSLSSCINFEKMDLSLSEDLTYTFTEEDKEKLYNEMNTFEESLKSTSQIDVIGSWSKIMRDAYAIATYRNIERLLYDCNGTEANYDKYLYFSDILTDVSEWQESMYKKIADSSYKSLFFDGYTEEEIQAFINKKKPDKYYELDTKAAELIKEYENLNSSEINTKANDIYLSLVNIYQQEATLLGYSNYMEYMYKETYGREYTPNQTTDFTKYVKDYLVPLSDTLSKNQTKAYDSLSLSELDQLNAFMTSDYDTYMDLFTEYAGFIGDDFKKSFDYLFQTEASNKKRVFKANSSSNTDGAYTNYFYIETLDEPFIFLGKSPQYRNLETMVHEFGHYNAFKIHGAGELSYDLAETQSQGDEALLVSYLQTKDYFSDHLRSYIETYFLSHMVYSIICSSIVNEFEYKVYTTNITSSNELDTIYKNICTSYNMDIFKTSVDGYAVDYWKATVITNPCYYISYAVSAVGALELYATSKDNMNLAVGMYKNIYNPTNLKKDGNKLTLLDFCDVLDTIGLNNPFKEEAYTLISKLGD